MEGGGGGHDGKRRTWDKIIVDFFGDWGCVTWFLTGPSGRLRATCTEIRDMRWLFLLDRKGVGIFQKSQYATVDTGWIRVTPESIPHGPSGDCLPATTLASRRYAYRREVTVMCKIGRPTQRSRGRGLRCFFHDHTASKFYSRNVEITYYYTGRHVQISMKITSKSLKIGWDRKGSIESTKVHFAR
jgi:hypothetical protein